MNISFKASFVANTTIKEKKQDAKSEDKLVSFIKFNPKNEDDVNCLKDIAIQWKGSKFAPSIYEDAYCDGHWWDEDITKEYYALTEQMNGFEKANAKKVLGIVEIEQYSKVLEFIHYLQVNPLFMWDNDISKYKHVGSAILSLVKQLCPNRDILLDPEDGTEPFYIKNGYNKIENCSKMILKQCDKSNK